MPRVLGAERQTLEIKDRISGETMTLFYRMLTNGERMQHTSATMKRKKGQVIIKANQFLEQVQLGAKIMLGFEKGAFADKTGKLISSDEGDPDYAPDWREQVQEGASDILALLGRHVINSAAAADEDTGLVYEDLEDVGSDPTPSSSVTSTPAAAQSAPAQNA